MKKERRCSRSNNHRITTIMILKCLLERKNTGNERMIGVGSVICTKIKSILELEMQGMGQDGQIFHLE